MTVLQPPTSALWRRLDGSGHDACRVERVTSGWRIGGSAVFLHEGAGSCLNYRVECDDLWRSQRGRVEGWIGASSVDVTIERTRDGKWFVNSEAVPRLAGCIDLDYSFTPATNLIPIRRLRLDVGESAMAPAAWLTGPADRVMRLSQRYERRTPAQYAYSAAEANFATTIDVAASGFALRYPPLWELVYA